MKLKDKSAVSLFSGALGLDLGLEEAGFTTCAAVECNASAITTINENAKLLRDPNLLVVQKKLTQDNIEEICDLILDAKPSLREKGVSLLSGAPPCQPFSTAGKRLSIQDERASGFDIMFAAVRKLQPSFFVIENVAGVLSAAQQHRPLAQRGPGFPPLSANEQYGSAFHQLLKSLGELCSDLGYCATWGILNAADYGVPQKRSRLVIIGSRYGYSVWPAQSHSSKGEMGLERWVSLREGLRDLNEEHPVYRAFSSQTKEFIEQISPGGNWRDLPEDLKEKALGKAYQSWGGRSGFLRRLAWDEPSPTITRSPIGRATLLCHPSECRPLTVRECARVQGFPDKWLFTGGVFEQYQQVGNATPVGLGKAIGKAILSHFGKSNSELHHGEVFCAQPELIRKISKRPRTQLNPFSMRPGADRESDLRWLGGAASLRHDAKDFKVRPKIDEKEISVIAGH